MAVGGEGVLAEGDAMKARRERHRELCWAVVCDEGAHLPRVMHSRSEARDFARSGQTMFGIHCCRAVRVVVREVL